MLGLDILDLSPWDPLGCLESTAVSHSTMQLGVECPSERNPNMDGNMTIFSSCQLLLAWLAKMASQTSILVLLFEHWLCTMVALHYCRVHLKR